MADDMELVGDPHGMRQERGHGDVIGVPQIHHHDFDASPHVFVKAQEPLADQLCIPAVDGWIT